MTTAHPQLSDQFKAGDKVFMHVAKDEASEILLAATVLRTLESGVEIRFSEPTELGDTDVVNSADLTLVSESTEECNAAPQKTLLEHARDCVRRGWFVFPCYPKLKLPAGEVVPHGVKDATNDENQLRAWWDKNPNYNPAIALGPSNLVVYDFDSIKPFNNLPATFTVQTGREPVNDIAGIQKYFVGSCKTHAHIGGGGEVRSRGAYVLAPGAIHPSGNPYKIIVDIPLAPSPVQNEEVTKLSGPPVGTEKQEKLAAYIEDAFEVSGIDYQSRVAHGDGGLKWLIRCPWNAEHTSGKDFDTSSAVIMWPDGKKIYECKHAHCLGIRQWQQLREFMEQKVGRYLPFGDPFGGVTINSTPVGAKPQPAQVPDGSTSKPPQTGLAGIAREMTMRRADKFNAEVIPWLWPNRIVANNVNVFSGEPDQGKSLCWTDLVARLTTGRDFPDCSNDLGGPVDAVVMASEDDISSTIIPRLIAAEADLTRVHFAVVTENVSGTISEGIAALDRDLPTLNTLLEQLKQTGISIALIVVDPIIAFIGDADPNKDKEIRPIFSRMKTFSKKNGVAWLTVNHLNKNSNATSINRTSGAKSFVSAPRASWMFAADPDNQERRLMMKGKGNLVKQGLKTLAYRIVETFIEVNGKPFLDSKQRPVGVPRIVWDGESEHTADDVLQSAADPESRRSVKAEELIQKLLDESPTGVVLASTVYEAGELESPSILANKLKRAKAKLKVETFRFAERWYWAKGKTEMHAFKASGGVLISKSEQDNTLFEQEEAA
jgi:putative DNA primase/helicase